MVDLRVKITDYYRPLKIQGYGKDTDYRCKYN